jgi:hypothetical protein
MMKRHQWAVGASGLDRPLRMQWCCGRGVSVSLQRLDVYEEGCAREQKRCMSRKAVAITCAATVSPVSVQDDVDGSNLELFLPVILVNRLCMILLISIGLRHE